MITILDLRSQIPDSRFQIPDSQIPGFQISRFQTKPNQTKPNRKDKLKYQTEKTKPQIKNQRRESQTNPGSTRREANSYFQ